MHILPRQTAKRIDSFKPPSTPFPPQPPMTAHVRPAAAKDTLLTRRENDCRIRRCRGAAAAATATAGKDFTPAPCSGTTVAGRPPRKMSLELLDDILGGFVLPSPAPEEMQQPKKKRKR